MVVECEHCRAKFKMDPQKIGPKGVKVRCAKCKNVFTVKPQAEASDSKASPQVATGTEGILDSLNAAVAGDPFAALEPPLPSAAPAPAKETKPKADLTDPFADLEIPGTEKKPNVEIGKVDLSSRPAKIPPSLAQKSSPGAAKLPQVSPPKPIVTETLTPLHKLQRAGTTVGVILAGILGGLLAAGVFPTPTRLMEAWRYGFVKTPAGLQVLKHRARIVTVPPDGRALVVEGDLYNNSDRPVEKLALSIEAVAAGSGSVAKISKPCCAKPIGPKEIVPFVVQAELPPGDIASYRISAGLLRDERAESR